MVDTTKQQPPIVPLSAIQRRAEALAELQQLHAEYAGLQLQCDDQRRQLDRLEDRNSLLLDELRTAQQNERVVTRKLMRLACAMANIGALSREAEAIVRSAKEWHDDETAQAENPQPPPEGEPLAQEKPLFLRNQTVLEPNQL